MINMSYIKFDEHELTDFFINEPTILDEVESLLFYDTDKMGIKVSLIINIYYKSIDLHIAFNERCIFDYNFYNINEIVRGDDSLYIYFEKDFEKNKRIRITRKNNLFSIALEEDIF